MTRVFLRGLERDFDVISNTVWQKLAGGKNSHFVDLMLVGNVDKLYMIRLVEKVEELPHLLFKNSVRINSMVWVL